MIEAITALRNNEIAEYLRVSFLSVLTPEVIVQCSHSLEGRETRRTEEAGHPRDHVLLWLPRLCLETPEGTARAGRQSRAAISILSELQYYLSNSSLSRETV
jgi:hypothetical protein